MTAGLTPEAEKVIEKIQKLLNQASDKGVTPEKKEAFQAKAQALMLQHNLDTGTVERNTGGSGKREQAMVDGGFYRWQRDLWEDVAEVNFCTYWSQVYWVVVPNARRKYKTGGTYVVSTEVRRRRHAMIGRTVNVRATEVMARYLETAIERAVDERYPNDADRYRDHVASYREGIAYRLGQRIRSRRYEELQKEREELDRAKNTAEKGDVSTATALTISSYSKSEEDANYDFKHGEGAAARRDERARRYAEERRKELDAYTQWAAANPEEARAKEEVERKREEKRSRSASDERFGHVRDSAFWAGVEAGDKISLDQQVDGGSASVRKIGRR